jgi:hypothetical protein
MDNRHPQRLFKIAEFSFEGKKPDKGKIKDMQQVVSH